MKKKVLFLVNHDVVIYNFRRELVEELLNQGYEVVISSPYGERIDDLIKMGCVYKELSINRHGTSIKEDFKLIRTYKKLIEEINPHVVLTYTIKPNIYGGIASQLTKTPYIANITGLGTAVENPGVMQKITTLLYKFAFRKIDCVFFQNEENMDFFKKRKITNRKIKLIPGSGVNLDQFSLLEYPSDETIEFVYISRIMKEKGIDQYIAAAEYITENYENVKFHICGFCEEAYEDNLKDLQEKGTITYHGMVRDIREVLKYTHCTIHPTYYPEGMSNILLESAASGRPLITTDRSGCREVVDLEKNGFIVQPKDEKSLIKEIENFLKIPYEKKIEMGLNGRQKMKNEFDRKIVVDEYMKEIGRI